MENNENFSYTYCAEQKREVEEIRKKYLPKEEDKMEQLRKLHSIPAHKARAVALTLGILGSLILGTGMSMVLTDMAASWGMGAMVAGILLGLVGLVLAALAYPAYNRVLQTERRRIAPQILQLTDELLQ